MIEYSKKAVDVSFSDEMLRMKSISSWSLMLARSPPIC